MSDIPILCEWDGEALVPVNRVWAQRADKQWVVGEHYQAEVRHERSIASHRAYFAAINETFQNLPEDQAERFASPDHLRRWCLIKAGYRDERSIACTSKAEAQRVAAFVKPLDGYAVVVVSEAAVTVWTAKSQSMKAMGKVEFQASRQAVLDILADLIGASRESLQENTGRAA